MGMQFRNILVISVFIGLCAFTFGVKLMGRSSVFAPENYTKKDSDKLLDMVEAKRLQAKNMKIRNPVNKFIKPQVVGNSTDPIPEIIYEINFTCNDGEYFDKYLGKCLKLNSNNTEMMITAHPTKTQTKVSLNQNITIAPCLNKTENKYDDKVVNLTFIPGKDKMPSVSA